VRRFKDTLFIIIAAAMATVFFGIFTLLLVDFFL